MSPKIGKNLWRIIKQLPFPKRWNYLVINNLIYESKFLTLLKQWSTARVGRLWSLCWICTFVVKLYNTWKKKKQINWKKTPVSCLHFDWDVYFFRELFLNTQDNLIIAAAEFDVTFDFAIYLCSQKYNRKIECSKNLPKCFSLMITFYICD